MWTKPCVDISVSGMSQVLFVQDLTKRPALGVNLKMLRNARLFPLPTQHRLLVRATCKVPRDRSKIVMGWFGDSFRIAKNIRYDLSRLSRDLEINLFPSQKQDTIFEPSTVSR